MVYAMWRQGCRYTAQSREGSAPIVQVVLVWSITMSCQLLYQGHTDKVLVQTCVYRCTTRTLRQGGHSGTRLAWTRQAHGDYISIHLRTSAGTSVHPYVVSCCCCLITHMTVKPPMQAWYMILTSWARSTPPHAKYYAKPSAVSSMWR